MRDMKERLSVLWIFALLNYLYADVIALWPFSARHRRTLHTSCNWPSVVRRY
jgi:hypothetical protein